MTSGKYFYNSIKVCGNIYWNVFVILESIQFFLHHLLLYSISKERVDVMRFLINLSERK